MEPATVEWSPAEIDALLMSVRGPVRGVFGSDDADETVMLPPPSEPPPPSSRPSPRPLRRPLPPPLPSPTKSEPRRDLRERLAELGMLASLAVLGFGMGLTGIAVLCAFANRPL
jgi:hypothetical protein